MPFTSLKLHHSLNILRGIKSPLLVIALVFGSSFALTAQAAVNYTVSGLPDGTTSVRIHSGAFGWDINHPDGVATDNGDGTWTATLDPAWSADTDYKWFINGTTEENLLDDVAAGTCSDDINTDGANWANRWWRAGSGDATDVYGQCDEGSNNGGDTGGSTDPVALSIVTFSVDMTGVDLQGQVPTVNGTFNYWCGDCYQMTDEDGDNVWTIDIELADGDYEYKFALGAWVDQEAVPGACALNASAEFVNRAVTVDGAGVVLATTPWSGCPAGTVVEPEPVYTVEDGFQFIEAFGGTAIDGSVFTFPTGAQSWGVDSQT